MSNEQEIEKIKRRHELFKRIIHVSLDGIIDIASDMSVDGCLKRTDEVLYRLRELVRPELEIDDRAVTRKEAAQMLGVCPQTISLYVNRGIIKPIRLGEARARASGYSLRSIKKALEMTVVDDVQ